MKTLGVLLMVVAVAGLSSAPSWGEDKKDDPAKKDLDKLRGSWLHTSYKRDGKETTADQFKEKPRSYEFKGDKLTFYSGEKAVMTGTIKLDPTKSPGHIDLTWDNSKDVMIMGIYKIEGDTLTFCFAIPGKVKDRPAEFKPGEGLSLSVHKKTK